jgi:hypothetical protein
MGKKRWARSDGKAQARFREARSEGSAEQNHELTVHAETDEK